MIGIERKSTFGLVHIDVNWNVICEDIVAYSLAGNQYA
jgi:hypothetical protein